MDAKVVVFFRQHQRDGWTEVYYWTGPDGDPLPIYDDIAALVDRRRNLLTLTAYVQAVRVERLLSLRPSDDPQPVSLVSFWNQFELQGRRGTFVTHPTICIIANSYPALPPGWKLTFLHGCPPEFVEYSPAKAAFGVISDAGAAYFQLWSDLLRGADRDYTLRGQWCVLRSSITDPDSGRQPITDVQTTDGPGWYYRVAVAEPGRVRANDLVTVGRVKGCGVAGINGDWFVREVGGGLVTLRRSTFDNAGLEPDLLDAYLRPHIYELSPIVKTYYRRTSDRDTGRRYYRYSWAPTIPGQRGAVHPCGIAMDYLRSGYFANMRTFRSGELPWLVAWFRVDDSTPLWLSETPFRSLNWHEPKRNVKVGEQRPWEPDCPCEPQPYYKGTPPADFTALMACGSPLAWRQGGTPGTDAVVVVPADLIPQCCKGPGMTSIIPIGKGWGRADYASDSGAQFACGTPFPTSPDLGYPLNRYCTLMVMTAVVIGDDAFLPDPPTCDSGWLTVAASHVEADWAGYFWMGVVPLDGTAYPTFYPAEGTILAASAMLSDHRDEITLGNEAWGNEGPGWYAPILGAGSETCYQVYQFTAVKGDPACPGPAAAYCQLYEAPVKYGLPTLPLPGDATGPWYSLSLIQPALRGGQWGQLTSPLMLRGPSCQDTPPAGYQLVVI